MVLFSGQQSHIALSGAELPDCGGRALSAGCPVQWGAQLQ